MRKSFEVDEALLEDYAKFYMSTYKLPPLAARIAAHLLFDFAREGLSFQELTEIFSASKSSVSTALNQLLKLKLIKDFCKDEERRRYFTGNPEYAKIRFNHIAAKLATEVGLIDRLHGFRQGISQHEQDKFEIYKCLLTSNITNIQNSLKKLYDEA